MSKRRRIAYTITDSMFGEFHVYKSANAWWMDRSKVQKIIDAFKLRHSLETVFAYAGITRHQYEYFVEQHPDFKRVKEISEQVPFIRGMNAIMADMDNPQTAKWYLNKRHPDFNPRLRPKEDEAHKCPDVDTTRIEEILSQSARDFIRQHQLEESSEYKIINSKEAADRVIPPHGLTTTSGIANLTLS